MKHNRLSDESIKVLKLFIGPEFCSFDYQIGSAGCFLFYMHHVFYSLLLFIIYSLSHTDVDLLKSLKLARTVLIML